MVQYLKTKAKCLFKSRYLHNYILIDDSSIPYFEHWLFPLPSYTLLFLFPNDALLTFLNCSLKNIDSSKNLVREEMAIVKKLLWDISEEKVVTVNVQIGKVKLNVIRN